LGRIRRLVEKPLHRLGLFARGEKIQIEASSPAVQNVYHACIQKTGSQWIRTVFADPEIRQASRLAVHPQFRYDQGSFMRTFPRYTFVPGLYIPYSLYTEIKKPTAYRTIYVVRDPREVIVSWYFSMRDTHRPMGRVPYYRRQLRQLDRARGLAFCIRELQLRFAFVRSWWDNRDDPHVHVVRFENLVARPFATYKAALAHCQIRVEDAVLNRVLDRYTKAKMRERDLKRRRQSGDGAQSHYRQGKQGWRELFEPWHLDLFHQINGDLLSLLGYAENESEMTLRPS
jgi:hypothetical protein